MVNHSPNSSAHYNYNEILEGHCPAEKPLESLAELNSIHFDPFSYNNASSCGVTEDQIAQTLLGNFGPPISDVLGPINFGGQLDLSADENHINDFDVTFDPDRSISDSDAFNANDNAAGDFSAANVNTQQGEPNTRDGDQIKDLLDNCTGPIDIAALANLIKHNPNQKIFQGLMNELNNTLPQFSPAANQGIHKLEGHANHNINASKHGPAFDSDFFNTPDMNFLPQEFDPQQFTSQYFTDILDDSGIDLSSDFTNTDFFATTNPYANFSDPANKCSGFVCNRNMNGYSVPHGQYNTSVMQDNAQQEARDGSGQQSGGNFADQAQQSIQNATAHNQGGFQNFAGHNQEGLQNSGQPENDIQNFSPNNGQINATLPEKGRAQIGSSSRRNAAPATSPGNSQSRVRKSFNSTAASTPRLQASRRTPQHTSSNDSGSRTHIQNVLDKGYNDLHQNLQLNSNISGHDSYHGNLQTPVMLNITQPQLDFDYFENDGLVGQDQTFDGDGALNNPQVGRSSLEHAASLQMEINAVNTTTNGQTNAQAGSYSIRRAAPINQNINASSLLQRRSSNNQKRNGVYKGKEDAWLQAYDQKVQQSQQANTQVELHQDFPVAEYNNNGNMSNDIPALPNAKTHFQPQEETPALPHVQDNQNASLAPPIAFDNHVPENSSSKAKGKGKAPAQPKIKASKVNVRDAMNVYPNYTPQPLKVQDERTFPERQKKAIFVENLFRQLKQLDPTGPLNQVKPQTYLPETFDPPKDMPVDIKNLLIPFDIRSADVYMLSCLSIDILDQILDMFTPLVAQYQYQPQIELVNFPPDIHTPYSTYIGHFAHADSAKKFRTRARWIPKKGIDVDHVKRFGRRFWVKRIYESMIDRTHIIDKDQSIHRARFMPIADSKKPTDTHFESEDFEASAHKIFDAAITLYEKGSWTKPRIYNKIAIRGNLVDRSSDRIEQRLDNICKLLRLSKAAVDDAMRGGIGLLLLVENPNARFCTKISNNKGNEKRGKRLNNERRISARMLEMEERVAAGLPPVADAEPEIENEDLAHSTLADDGYNLDEYFATHVDSVIKKTGNNATLTNDNEIPIKEEILSDDNATVSYHASPRTDPLNSNEYFSYHNSPGVGPSTRPFDTSFDPSILADMSDDNDNADADDANDKQ